MAESRRCRSRDKSASWLMSVYLNCQLECPNCLTIRLRIPVDAEPSTPIVCDDCGHYLGTWDELVSDFEQQGGEDGIFRLNNGRIRRLD